MSALARVLGGRTVPGVYRWDSAADVADIRHAVEHAGWIFVHLDTWQVEDKAAFLAACAEAFEFPEWFGGNLDALADSLSDVRGEEGVLVLWDGWSPIARHDRRVFDVVSDIFVGRVHFERGGRFAVLVRGAGPDDSGLAPAPGD